MSTSPEQPTSRPVSTEGKRCGIVMPISACDGLTEQHWSEVKSIISDAVDSAGFVPNLVSDADDVGIIQKRIIQNLYDNPIVVCDVSAKNPNVMFELGLRLAFDKPTIIVKDDKTTYSFDTSPIEHLEYPRDLRFSKIVEFKKELTDKVKATVQCAATDPNYTTFLKHFGKFTVAKLETAEVSKDDFIIEELRDLRSAIMKRDSLDRELAQQVRFSRVSGDETLHRVRSIVTSLMATSEHRTPSALLNDPKTLAVVQDLLRADGREHTVDQVRFYIKRAMDGTDWLRPVAAS
jgi:hypothetical protein